MFYGQEFDDIIEQFFNNKNKGNYNVSTVIKNQGKDDNYEVNHTSDGAYLFFEAPGFNKSNLKVEMENGFIEIHGKRTYKLNGEEKVKTISKQFKIGENYDPSSIEATIEDGLLTVFVPGYKKQDKKRISLL